KNRRQKNVGQKEVVKQREPKLSRSGGAFPLRTANVRLAFLSARISHHEVAKTRRTRRRAGAEKASRSFQVRVPATTGSNPDPERVAFQSPGSRATASAPWVDGLHSRINPEGVALRRIAVVEERRGSRRPECNPFRVGATRRAANPGCAPSGRDPGRRNVTPSGCPAACAERARSRENVRSSSIRRVSGNLEVLRLGPASLRAFVTWW